MGQKVTIGGERVGSGKKMQAELHNYFRSTHDLSEKFASSAAAGVLYPCLCKVGLRGDAFDIKINADARTIPTQGPLFGSFKMQVDIYQVPVRLYQGILHNNPLAIGLKMNQVKFPMVNLYANTQYEGEMAGKMNTSCLMKYLGLSGIGVPYLPPGAQPHRYVERRFNAVPMLAYYDIFKNYYANKQEENAYVITSNISGNAIESDINNIEITTRDAEDTGTTTWKNQHQNDIVQVNKFAWVTLTGTDLNDNITIAFVDDSMEQIMSNQLNNLTENEIQWVEKSNTKYVFRLDLINIQVVEEVNGIYGIKISNASGKVENVSQLTPFELSKIDDMRYDILSHNRLGDTFIIGDTERDETYKGNYLPYSTNFQTQGTNKWSPNKYPMNGLVVKTYQNDIFNNWLNSDWIDGEGSVNELTKVSVVNGSFSMDALNFAQKLYNMLNRVVVAGNTYEDWQDVVYEEVKRRQIESPIFCGGMSQEIMFEEIVQNTPTNDSPLGSLGGRGKLIGTTKKGGKLHIKCDEACFIIGIVSLTPRLFYSQGNEFYLTDIETMDDFHKPAMDGIGFQDLIGERMAWFDTRVYSAVHKVRSKIGKLPAWIEYMTSVDKAFGDFGEDEGRAYMILNRNYEYDGSGIVDATTYVDPRKFNYAFANTELTAQNFWIEIAFDIRARRLMSARLIPNV